jgi:hypothetical protein
MIIIKGGRPAMTYEQLLHEAEALPREAQIQLVERLTARLREDSNQGPPKKRPRWEDYGGTAPYPLCGEDAQDWVSRTRKEGDEHRRIA